MKTLFYFCLIFGSLTAFAQSFKEKFPTTAANIEGQKKLYQEGWFIFTSFPEALKMAREENETARKALERTLKNMRETTTETSLKTKISNMLNMMNEMEESSLAFKKEMKQDSKALERKITFDESLKALTIGYLQYSKTNKRDLENLKKVNAEVFGKVSGDLSSVDESLIHLREQMISQDEASWKNHFQEGKVHIQKHYEASGEKSNSLSGNWEMLKGYVKFLYSSLVKPSAVETKVAAEKVGYYTTHAVLKSYTVASGIVYSLGSNFYYGSKLGYRLVSPSVEAGYLAGLSLGSIMGTKSKQFILKSAGIINRVAVKAVKPIVGGTQLVISQSADMTKTAVTYLGYGVSGGTEVILEKSVAGVAIGYSALSQLPPQILLTAVNSAIFLAWDGPRLVLYQVRGIVGDKHIDRIIPGTMIDLEQAKKEGLQVEEIKLGEKIMEQILRNSSVQP